MKKAVSVSLGNPSRDKRVTVNFKGVSICIERIGTGGDVDAARRLFSELDGKVDALSVGGIDLYVRLEGREYPIRAALKLVQDVNQTPLVDGRALKYTLERRVFQLAEPELGKIPHFDNAFMPFSIDRLGLAQAITAVADDIYFGDFMFALDIPVAVRGLQRFKRIARIVMPIVSYFPMSMLFPPGSKDEKSEPKHLKYWLNADLIAGDMHYIRAYSPEDLSGKVVITNTTTDDNIALLRRRGIKTVITTTPRYEGRSFGVNMMEAVLTAYAGKGRPLQDSELDELIDELDLKPEIIHLDK